MQIKTYFLTQEAENQTTILGPSFSNNNIVDAEETPQPKNVMGALNCKNTKI